MLRLVIGTLVRTTKDDVSRIVAVGLNDGGKTLLGDGKERVRGRGSPDGVDLHESENDRSDKPLCMPDIS